MHSAPEVEIILAHVLGEVLVAGDTGGLECFGGDLLDLVGDNVNDEGEGVSTGFLPTDIVDSDFGIRHTPVVSGFGVRLAPADSVATSWSSAHLWL